MNICPSPNPHTQGPAERDSPAEADQTGRMLINRLLRRHRGAWKNHKQISVPVCSPEIFSRTKLSRSTAGGGFAVNPARGNCKSLVHLCPPASVDECADGLVRSCSTGVEVGAVPWLYHPHKVGTFALDKGEEHKWNSNTVVPS